MFQVFFFRRISLFLILFIFFVKFVLAGPNTFILAVYIFLISIYFQEYWLKMGKPYLFNTSCSSIPSCSFIFKYGPCSYSGGSSEYDGNSNEGSGICFSCCGKTCSPKSSGMYHQMVKFFQSV